MNIDQAISQIDEFLAGFDSEMKRISEELAMNAKALIVHRIQTVGLTGRKYSTHKLPAFFFEGRELNAGGRNLVDRHKKRSTRDAQVKAGEKVRKNKSLDELEYGISYTEWRRANGLQVDHVDATFSGRMFQNLQIVSTEKQGDTYITRIGAINPETQQKLIWNTLRFGDFLKPSPEEKTQLDEIFINRIKAYSNLYFK